jgi:predicted flap endonuclease-1-like 5' DNA nuclease
VKIEELEGVGPAFAAKLQGAGVATTESLLQQAGSRAGRDRLAAATGLDARLILEWVNRADLFRINGVGSEFSDLLEAAGVDSPAELARRNAANLVAAFQDVVARKPDIVRRVPSESVVAGWIEQAKALPRAVEH